MCKPAERSHSWPEGVVVAALSSSSIVHFKTRGSSRARETHVPTRTKQDASKSFEFDQVGFLKPVSRSQPRFSLSDRLFSRQFYSPVLAGLRPLSRYSNAINAQRTPPQRPAGVSEAQSAGIPPRPSPQSASPAARAQPAVAPTGGVAINDSSIIFHVGMCRHACIPEALFISPPELCPMCSWSILRWEPLRSVL